MNPTELHKKLIAAARCQAPDDRVPYAFEQRIMAHIAARATQASQVIAWGHSLWRAAVSCMVVALLLGAWTLLTPSGNSGSDDLSQDFQNTLLASVDQADSAAPMP